MIGGMGKYIGFKGTGMTEERFNMKDWPLYAEAQPSTVGRTFGSKQWKYVVKFAWQ